MQVNDLLIIYFADGHKIERYPLSNAWYPAISRFSGRRALSGPVTASSLPVKSNLLLYLVSVSTIGVILIQFTHEVRAYNRSGQINTESGVISVILPNYYYFMG